jgi:hypothetical protein
MASARCGKTLSNRVPRTAPTNAPTARHAPIRHQRGCRDWQHGC